jgi:hypothetical protein
MTTILSKFNEQFVNFLQEMCNLFPEDKKLTSFLYSVELLKKTNPREIMNQFKTHVGPFETQLLARDETFFINNTFNIQSSSAVSDMLRIKHIWNSGKLSAADKECIWNYFKVFFYLIHKEK